MTQTIRKALKWLLCGGAFVAVIAAAGCSGRHQSSRPPALIIDPYRAAPTEATAQKADKPDASDSDSSEKIFDNSEPAETKPPVVNIFGEVDGKAPSPAKQLGEAGFQQHTYLDEGYDANVSVSPDGKWIVF